VDVSPDQQLYVKIVSLNSWGMSVSAAGTVRAMLFTPGLSRRGSRKPKSLATAPAFDSAEVSVLTA